MTSRLVHKVLPVLGALALLSGVVHALLLAPIQAQDASPIVVETPIDDPSGVPSATVADESPTFATTAEPSAPTAIAPIATNLQPGGTATAFVSAAAISILVDGVAAPKSVAPGTSVVLSTAPAGMSIRIWLGPACSGTASSTIDDGDPVSLPYEGTGSFQAFEPGNPANTSPCLTVTWTSLTPTAVVTPGTVKVLVDGVAASKTVLVGSSVTISTAPTGTWLRVYPGLGCSGTASLDQLWPGPVPITQTTSFAIAF